MPPPKNKAYYLQCAYIVAEYATGTKKSKIAKALGTKHFHIDGVLKRVQKGDVYSFEQFLAAVRKHTRDAPSLYGLPEPQLDTPEHFFMHERGPISLHGALLHPQPED